MLHLPILTALIQRFLTRVLWPTLYGQIQTLRRRTLRFHHGRVHGLVPLHVCTLTLTSGFASGAGYTFGSGVVYKFLETNQMSHILRAHQLCMEGYTSLFDEHLSTVWSAPNYCYRCGNSASILEVGPGGSMFFNVFQAAPENERDGPSHQAAQSAGGKVRQTLLYFSKACAHSMSALFCVSSLSPVYPVLSFPVRTFFPFTRSPVPRPAFFLIVCASPPVLLEMSLSPSTASRIFSITYVMQHTPFQRVVLTNRPGRQDPQWYHRNHDIPGHLHIKKRTLLGRMVAACALWQVFPWIAVLRMFAGLLLPDTAVRRLVLPWSASIHASHSAYHEGERTVVPRADPPTLDPAPNFPLASVRVACSACRSPPAAEISTEAITLPRPRSHLETHPQLT